MIFNNFRLNATAPYQHSLDEHFESECYICDDVTLVTYKEETMKRIVPKGSCLWKDDTDDVRQNMYRMHYIWKHMNTTTSQLMEKVTICQPDLFECRASLIKLMSALIANNVVPHWYHMKNTLVTERVIYLRDVCVYRDFLWNPGNPTSFMRKNQYHVIDDKIDPSYDGVNTLCHELSAIVKNCEFGRMLPSNVERPTSPKISGWPTPVVVEGWTPFWPHIKEDIVFSLKHIGLFDFNPTSAIKIADFLDQPFVSQERKDELQWLDGDAVYNCSFCEQDRCVWTMNREKITRNVECMEGDVPDYLYTNSDRRYDGGRLAIYIMNSGDGRRWDKTSVPKCVSNKLSIRWP